MSERIQIDEKYTYVFDEGRVSLDRYGAPWLGARAPWTGPLPGSQAWISAANQLLELRRAKREAEEIVERAFAYADELSHAGLVAEAWQLRDALKGRRS